MWDTVLECWIDSNNYNVLDPIKLVFDLVYISEIHTKLINIKTSTNAFLQNRYVLFQQLFHKKAMNLKRWSPGEIKYAEQVVKTASQTKAINNCVLMNNHCVGMICFINIHKTQVFDDQTLVFDAVYYRVWTKANSHDGMIFNLISQNAHSFFMNLSNFFHIFCKDVQNLVHCNKNTLQIECPKLSGKDAPQTPLQSLRLRCSCVQRPGPLFQCFSNVWLVQRTIQSWR